MEFKPMRISGLWELTPSKHADKRGHFLESYNQKAFNEHIGKCTFVQDNEVFSTKGVLRGLHMQKAPNMQAKLVRAVEGEILDVAVDFREESPTYLQHVAVRLSAQNKKQLFVPHGFLHGYVVLSPSAVVHYKVDNFWVPGAEFGLRFDDSALNIDWLLSPQEYIVSEKDMELPLLHEATKATF